MTRPVNVETVAQESEPGATSTELDAPSRHRLRAWIVVAACVFVIGVTASTLGALAMVRGSAVQSQHAFTTASNQVAAGLTLDIGHEQDLMTGAMTLIAADPAADDAVDALARYPELVGMGHTVPVSASGLATDAVQDPSGPLGLGHTFVVEPAGNRSFSCFPVAQLARSTQDHLPVGRDFCAGVTGRASLAARDSGQSASTVVRDGSHTLLCVVTPVYSVSGIPPTVAQRRAHFLGWIGTALLPGVILDRAVQGQAGDIGVVWRYHAYGSNASFHDGRVRGATVSQVRRLQDGWSMETFGVVTPASVFADPAALVLLLCGVAVTLLLVTLLLVLASARSRALRLVDVRTAQLSHQASHDALTGLPNRALILDRTDQLLARARPKGTPVAAMFVDLDDFKTVNDTLGHEVGDRVLLAVGRRLRTALCGADTVGRLGGDEFVVLVDGCNGATPELLAERIFRVLRQPLDLGGVPSPVVVTASIGIATGNRPDPRDLLRDADLALYAAKGAGKNRAEVFRPELKCAVDRRYELERDLRGALGRGELQVVYQPLHSLETLRLKGVEVLLRWQHPTHGEIPPDTFVPILEETGGIVEVGRWVLWQACQQAAAWRARGHAIDVSVNVSARQLDHEGIVGDVRHALEQNDLDPRSLILEITETALMHNVEASTRRLHDLKEIGVRMAIDDFGTGYSSLAYLQRFPVDCLKIDRSFIATIDRSAEAGALVHAVVKLAKDLGLTTIAEGVETQAQMERLRRARVDDGQGYLFECPLDAATFDARLRRTERKHLEEASDWRSLVGSGATAGLS